MTRIRVRVRANVHKHTRTPSPSLRLTLTLTPLTLQLVPVVDDGQTNDEPEFDLDAVNLWAQRASSAVVHQKTKPTLNSKFQLLRKRGCLTREGKTEAYSRF